MLRDVRDVSYDGSARFTKKRAASSAAISIQEANFLSSSAPPYVIRNVLSIRMKTNHESHVCNAVQGSSGAPWQMAKNQIVTVSCFKSLLLHSYIVMDTPRHELGSMSFPTLL